MIARPQQRLARAVVETLEARKLLSSDLSASELSKPGRVPHEPIADHTIALMTAGRRVAFTGELSVTNPQDTYRFQIDEPLAITAKLLDLTVDSDLRLFNASGELIQESAKNGNKIELLSRTLKPGVYFLQILPGDHMAGSYYLSLGAAGVVSPTRVGAAPLGGNSARVEWLDNSDNETSFRIEHAINGTWKKVGWAPPGATTVVVDGLTPDTGYQFRVLARSEDSVAPAMNYAQAVTASTDTTGWYQIDSLTFDGAIEAGWTIDAQDLAIKPQFVGQWIYAGSWEAAVNQAVEGTATINRGDGTTATHAFPTAGDFRTGLAGVMRDNGDGVADEGEIAGNELPNDSARKMIVVEDSYGDIDRDYDDFGWTLQTTFSTQAPDYGILYFNNFQAPLAGEWTPARTADVGGGEIVLGEFAGGESAVLSLANLPEHAALSLSYDLYLIDGTGGGGGLQAQSLSSSDATTAAIGPIAPSNVEADDSLLLPPPWPLPGRRPKGISVGLTDGPSIWSGLDAQGRALDVASIVPGGSPWPKGTLQPNRGRFGQGVLPVASAAAPSSSPVTASLAELSTASSLLGGSFTVHPLHHTFKHTDDTLSIDFASLPDQPSIGGGTWALDNVAITLLAEQMIRWEFEPGGPTPSLWEPNTHRGTLAFNGNFDEQNHDAGGVLVADNQPDAGTPHAGGHRIADADPDDRADDDLLVAALQLGFPATVSGGFDPEGNVATRRPRPSGASTCRIP